MLQSALDIFFHLDCLKYSTSLGFFYYSIVLLYKHGFMFINVHFKKVHHLHKKLLYEEYLYSKCFPLLDKLRN